MRYFQEAFTRWVEQLSEWERDADSGHLFQAYRDALATLNECQPLWQGVLDELAAIDKDEAHQQAVIGTVHDYIIEESRSLLEALQRAADEDRAERALSRVKGFMKDAQALREDARGLMLGQRRYDERRARQMGFLFGLAAIFEAQQPDDFEDTRAFLGRMAETAIGLTPAGGVAALIRLMYDERTYRPPRAVQRDAAENHLSLVESFTDALRDWNRRVALDQEPVP
ncbi:MAG: hypothetical protein AB7F65_00870 [Dehalococcoidia bacterium]